MEVPAGLLVYLLPYSGNVVFEYYANGVWSSMADCALMQRCISGNVPCDSRPAEAPDATQMRKPL